MSSDDKKPLAQQGAALLKQHKERVDRELKEACEAVLAENSPAARSRRIEFDPASVRVLRRSIPTTTREICIDTLERLCRDQRVTLYGGQLKFKSASAPTATPIDTVAKLRTLVHVVLGQTCTDDLCSEILKLTKE